MIVHAIDGSPAGNVHAECPVATTLCAENVIIDNFTSGKRLEIEGINLIITNSSIESYAVIETEIAHLNNVVIDTHFYGQIRDLLVESVEAHLGPNNLRVNKLWMSNSTRQNK